MIQHINHLNRQICIYKALILVLYINVDRRPPIVDYL